MKINNMPPRMLFVINEGYFFVSHRLALAKAAKAAGWDVHIAAPDDHVWAPSDFSSKDIEVEGFKFHAIPLSRRGKNPLKEIITFLSIFFLYRKLRPTLVHHITIKPNLYGGIAARLNRIPCSVYAFTGLGQIFSGNGTLASALRLVVIFLLRIALSHPNKKIIFQNKEDYNRFIKNKLVNEADSILIRGSGVNLQEFKFVPPPKETPLVILAGRLIWEKGIAEFVSAARLLHSKGIDAKFALIGDTKPSNPHSVPRETLEEWNREGIVEWWGFRKDMKSIIERSHIVCLPSTYGEGVPKILLEAAAIGRPIVSNDVPGCREAVIDGQSGYLVPPKDINLLANRLHDLIKDPDLIAEFGIQGRKLVEGSFDENSIALMTIEVYRSLLKGYK